jgi:hypothetical protein
MADTVVYDIEKENLETHVTLCAERYKRLEDKFEVLEVRLDGLSKEFADMKKNNEENMSELKALLQNSSDSRFKAVVAASATVVAAMISALAYVISRMP